MSKPIKRYKFWNGVALTAQRTSQPISMKLLDNAGITVNTSGVTVNTGTFTVEGTNDNPVDSFGNEITSGITWFALDGVTLTLAGANVTWEPYIQNFPWSWLRIKFATPGSTPNGTVVGIINAKGI